MKIEKNIVEKLMFMLDLEDNKSFNVNLYKYLDAASTEVEMDESRNVLFGIIASKLYSDYYNIIREQQNGEKLLNTIAGLGNVSISDKQFNDLMKQIEVMLKPLVRNKFSANLDVTELKNIAQEVGCTSAKMYLEEYENTLNTNKIVSALEEIIYTVRTKAALANKERKINKHTQVYIDGMSSLYRSIKEYFELGSKEKAEKGVKEIAKLTHKAYESINKPNFFGKDKETNEDKDKNTKNGKKNKLSVKITDALSTYVSDKKNKLSNFKLNRKPKKGKLNKSLISMSVALVILIVGTTVYGVVKNSKNNGDTKKPISSGNFDEIDTRDLLFNIKNGFIDAERLKDKVLVDLALKEAKSKEESSVADENTAETNATADPTATPVPTSVPEASAPSNAPIQTSAPTPIITPEAISTPKPVVTPEPTPEIDPYEAKVSEAANIVYNNFSMFTGYGYDDIADAIRVINGLESSMSIDTADAIICDVLNVASVPGVNNALSGEQLYGTNAVNLSSILIFNQEGKSAVSSMELNLNGALTDLNNLAIYGERAIIEEAIIKNNGVSGGVGINTGDPAARLLWARLAIYTNAIVNTLGSDYAVYMDGVEYTVSDINDSSLYEAMAASAKQELSNQKTR